MARTLAAIYPAHQTQEHAFLLGTDCEHRCDANEIAVEAVLAGDQAADCGTPPAPQQHEAHRARSIWDCQFPQHASIPCPRSAKLRGCQVSGRTLALLERSDLQSDPAQEPQALHATEVASVGRVARTTSSISHERLTISAGRF